MIRDMGNVELFELCETIPKVQCLELTMCTWSALKVNVKFLQKILLTNTEPCLNHEFPRVERKNYHARKI